MRHRTLLIVGLSLLSACGAKPLPLAEIEVPFTGESVLGEISGEQYRFFRYPSEEAAQADVAKVSADGKKIAGKRMPWDGPVHMYYMKKRIVIYVGSSPLALGTIQQVFGAQIAGDALPRE